MPMPLEEWNAKVKPRLDYISAGADMARRNAQALPVKPGFASYAEDDLKAARAVLEVALANVIEAQAEFQAKPADRSHAA